MTTFNFHKYQGTGNDFIMIDDRNGEFPYNEEKKSSFDTSLVENLCDRKFGIGADGLILIRNHPDFDFEMIYFNSDGSQSLCGNGSRCAVKFARSLGILSDFTLFKAIDGPHEAKIVNDLIHLKMGDVTEIERIGNQSFVDTGSPHLVEFVNNIQDVDVFNEGKRIRHLPRFSPGGTNVNFVEPFGENTLFVRTFERGVENETLSCGTGVTAVSLVAESQDYKSPVNIKTKGGDLAVSYIKTDDGKFREIYLIGPAEMVFEGKINVN